MLIHHYHDDDDDDESSIPFIECVCLLANVLFAFFPHQWQMNTTEQLSTLKWFVPFVSACQENVISHEIKKNKMNECFN